MKKSLLLKQIMALPLPLKPFPYVSRFSFRFFLFFFDYGTNSVSGFMLFCFVWTCSNHCFVKRSKLNRFTFM